LLIDASNVVQRTSPYLLKILRHKQREIQTGCTVTCYLFSNISLGLYSSAQADK